MADKNNHDGPLRMRLHVPPEDIDRYHADSRGRVTLGSDYADKEVRVAVLEIVDDGGKCPECESSRTVRSEEAGTRFCIQCGKTWDDPED